MSTRNAGDRPASAPGGASCGRSVCASPRSFGGICALGPRRGGTVACTVATAMMSALVRWFSEIGIEDIPDVGGKNASLGEMYCELGGRGVRVPNGFATTAYAYRAFLREAKLDRAIEDILAGLDTQNVADLR